MIGLDKQLYKYASDNSPNNTSDVSTATTKSQ